jgi:hypothetical protein
MAWYLPRHRTSHPMGTTGSFPGIKQPGREVHHSPPSSAEVKEWVELYFHSPNTPSWRGTQLKEKAQGQLCLYFYRNNFTFLPGTEICIFPSMLAKCKHDRDKNRWDGMVGSSSFCTFLNYWRRLESPLWRSWVIRICVLTFNPLVWKMSFLLSKGNPTFQLVRMAFTSVSV